MICEDRAWEAAVCRDTLQLTLKKALVIARLDENDQNKPSKASATAKMSAKETEEKLRIFSR